MEELATVGRWHIWGSFVHHLDPGCLANVRIPRRERRPGTGGKPICEDCREWWVRFGVDPDALPRKE